MGDLFPLILTLALRQQDLQQMTPDNTNPQLSEEGWGQMLSKGRFALGLDSNHGLLKQL